MDVPGSRPDAAALASRLARWRVPYGGRPLYRVAAGPRWLRLHLAGDERFCLLLSTVPGASLLCGWRGRLPEPLTVALPVDREHPAPAILAGATLTGLGALDGQRVACLRLTRPDGTMVHLLHQLFGSPGNTVLLDTGGRCLWAARRPPHALLSVVPARAVYGDGNGNAGEIGDGPLDGAPEPGDDSDESGLDQLARVLAGEQRAQGAAALARQLRAGDTLCERRQRELEAAGATDEHRRRAEALAAVLHTLRAGQARCETTDPRDGSPLVIELDPARSPAANLDALFHVARKAERGRDVIAAHLTRAQAETTALRARLESLTALDADAPGLAALAAVQDWAASGARSDGEPATSRGPGRRAEVADEAARPYRRYLIDGRWEVWVGRSSRENDELTHGAAHGRDLWFHAHGASGSHVVLRTGGRPDKVPPTVVERVASLAALHSKARHSSLVPVVWTEKRYVRKPRKAPPGLAITLQARTVMVPPGIGTGVEPA